MGIINRVFSRAKTLFFSRKTMANPPNMDSVYSHLRSKFSSMLQENLTHKVDSMFSAANFSFSENALINTIKHYSFLRALVDAIEIPLTDVIRKSPWEISIDPARGLNDRPEICSAVRTIERRVKDILSTFDIAEFVKGELSDWIMYGFKVYFLQIDQDDKIFVSKIVTDSSSAFYHRGRYKWVNIGELSKDNSVVSGKYAVPFFFERRVIRDIRESEAIGMGLINKEATNLSQIVLEFEEAIGIGFLDSVARDLFDLYLREVVYNWLSILEVVQPKLIGLTVNSDKFDSARITKMSENIEGLLNDTCSHLILNGMGGTNIEPLLLNMLANRYQVVPLTEEAASMEPIDVMSLTETLEAMKEDINQKKLYILQNKGIPEELHNGEGNRWQIIARTDKYLDNIKSACASIESFVKQFVLSICEQLGYEEVMSTDQINFTLDVSALTSNYVEESGFSFLSDRLSDLSDLLKNVDDIIDTGVVDKEKIRSYIYGKIKEIDPEISNAINFEESELTDEHVETVDEIASEMMDDRKPDKRPRR